ncbi:MAG: hypothetical protein JOY99_08785 [Sphingomonadaceae bacterium]|nr:hypothetical protein [Sphingomonadaceae bacterium]
MEIHPFADRTGFRVVWIEPALLAQTPTVQILRSLGVASVAEIETDSGVKNKAGYAASTGAIDIIRFVVAALKAPSSMLTIPLLQRPTHRKARDSRSRTTQSITVSGSTTHHVDAVLRATPATQLHKEQR